MKDDSIHDVPLGEDADQFLVSDYGDSAHSRNKGVFGGVSVDGSVLTVDDSANQNVYGKGVSGTDILVRGTVPVKDVTRPFVKALERDAPEPTN